MKNLPVLLLLWLPFFSFSQIIYVDSSAVDGQNTGADWANAFTDLQGALGQATAGMEIWVAKGTYYPTPGDDREIHFQLPGNVALLGGFAGGETNNDQRDWEQNKTILSGDIGIEGDSIDNSYTVIYAVDTGSDTRLDGFTVEWGTANSSIPLDPASGLKKSGGGFFIRGESTHAQMNIGNCTFRHNTAVSNGGAVFMINGSDNTSVNVHFENCLFQFNKAFYGGAIVKYGGGNANLENQIDNCRFEYNNANYGGAMYWLNTYGTNPVKILNSDFFYNASLLEGGAIDIQHLIPDSNNFTIQGCKFKENSSLEGGALFLRYFNYGEYSCRLIENQFLGNMSSASGGAIAFYHFYSGPNIFFESCTFINNKAETRGGAIMGCFREMNNCVFVKNTATNLGAAIHQSIIDTLTFNINNSVFYANSVNGSGGVISFIPHDKIEVYFNNSILVNNTAQNGENMATALSAGNDTIRIMMNNCLTDFDSCLGGIFIHPLGDPAIIECNAMIYNQDPLFRDTANLDFSLLACSPAVDAGDNAFVNILSDLAGNERIINGTVDIGAYEAPATFLTIDTLADAACFGENSGSVGFSYIGQPPFSTQWDNGTTTGNSTDSLAAGSYSLTVTDANDCSETIAFEIGQSDSLTASFTAHPVTCPNGNDGSARVAIQGGVPDYLITWSSGVMNDSTGLLTVGWYYVTITDGNDCELTDSVFIQQPEVISITGDITNASSSGSSDGAVEILDITGGTSPYQLNWNSGDTTPLIDNLAPGVYVVTVTDANGCTAEHGFLVSFMTGTEDIEKMEILVYPNPAIDEIAFVIPGNSGELRLRIFDLFGREMYLVEKSFGNNIIVRRGNLNSGLYLYRVEDKQGNFKTGKIIFE